MRSKDHYGNDQLSGQQVQDSLRQAGVKLDRGLVSRMMKAADIIGRGIYSIPGLMDLVTRALRAEVRDSAHARRHRSDTSRLDTPDAGDHDPTWRQILDINAGLPRQRTKSTSDDREIRLKNVMRLKTAMYSNYNQHQVSWIHSYFLDVIFDTQGYLPPKDAVQLSLAYSTVFHIKLDIEDLREAIQRCLKGKNTKVNIENFIKYILDVVL